MFVQSVFSIVLSFGNVGKTEKSFFTVFLLLLSSFTQEFADECRKIYRRLMGIKIIYLEIRFLRYRSILLFPYVGYGMIRMERIIFTQLSLGNSSQGRFFKCHCKTQLFTISLTFSQVGLLTMYRYTVYKSLKNKVSLRKSSIKSLSENAQLHNTTLYIM